LFCFSSLEFVLKMRVGRTYVYERDTRNKNSITFGVLALITGAIGIYTSYRSYNLFFKYRDYSASLKSLIIHPSGYGNAFSPVNTGNVIHVSMPQSDIIFDREVTDPAFNVKVPGAVTLSRNVEYCQWQEHVHERTVKTGEHTERVERTYTYTKGWRPYLVNSLFFDQPAAHHNPQRQPVSSGFVDSVGISSKTGFKVDSAFMSKLRDDISIFSFRPESLKDFVTSPAYLHDQFFYTGNNGWFLSKYNPSGAERAMKMAFEYIEGTLFDFQLGDLFSVCEAGDVRVQLQGKVLRNGMSVIAQQNADGSLTPFKTLQGRDIMLLQEGQADAQKMIDFEIGHQFWKLFRYTAGSVVLIALCALFVNLLKKEMKQMANENQKVE